MKKLQEKVNWFTPGYKIINFDPCKHSFLEDVLKSDIPVIFSCGDCKKYDRILSDYYDKGKPNFKVVKNNFLNDRGISKIPVPYLMIFIKGNLVGQFSFDNENAEILMKENLKIIQNFWDKKYEEELNLKNENFLSSNNLSPISISSNIKKNININSNSNNINYNININSPNNNEINNNYNINSHNKTNIPKSKNLVENKSDRNFTINNFNTNSDFLEKECD